MISRHPIFHVANRVRTYLRRRLHLLGHVNFEKERSGHAIFLTSVYVWISIVFLCFNSPFLFPLTNLTNFPVKILEFINLIWVKSYIYSHFHASFQFPFLPKSEHFGLQISIYQELIVLLRKEIHIEVQHLGKAQLPTVNINNTERKIKS